MPTPATPPEKRLSLLLLVVAAGQRLGQLVDYEFAADGIDAADYALLSLVGVRGPVRLTEVATELGMPLTTASDAIRRLESRAHVERLANPADRRSTLFALSTTGDAEWKRGWPALQRIDGALAELLDDPGSVRAALEELGRAFEHALSKGVDPKP